ncbi:MAG: ornithine carbamoyltransferase [Phycisphaeraceae bacterium]|nr:ornithine carbamoyltransferase [Phycisphaeraceae bacterium]
MTTLNQTPSLAGRDLLSIASLSAEELTSIMDLAERLKRDPISGAGALAGRSIIMLFEKASLRTRVSFEVGIHRLGGQAIYFDQSRQRLGERESIKDYARNLERWVDGIIARVFSHVALEELAEHADVPVVNALSDIEHPCQAIADVLTLRERRGSLDGARLCYIGDPNNVCHSLMLACATLGVGITVIAPPGEGPDGDIYDCAASLASAAGAALDVSTNPRDVAGHDAVYTDTWTSMGASSDPDRLRAFEPYRVTPELMARAGRDALFMHCLPATRGAEVVDEVIDSPASVVYDQAENRMHAQNALLAQLFAR